MPSILGGGSMSSPFFHELKKQASIFLREKVKTARLALTDTTPAQLLTEEVTSADQWSAPDARTMGFISRAAFEIDDYWRIVEILHHRLSKLDRKQWRESYHAVILLEHLLTHGPESVADEFQSDSGVIEELGTLQFVDEKGFNWGLTMRKKTERVLKLLEKGPLLKEERERSRKLARGIEGFGSFSHSHSAAMARREFGLTTADAGDRYGRSHSHYEDFSGLEEEPQQLRPRSETKAIVEDRSRHVVKAELQEEDDHPFTTLERNKGVESLLLLSQS